MKKRLALAATLALIGGGLSTHYLRTATAAAPPDITDSTYVGVEVFKGSLKGAGKTASLGTGTLVVDGGDAFNYTDADGIDYSGTVVQDGKKVLVTLDGTAVDNLETQFATIIETALALEGVDAGTVTVTIDTDKLKIKAKAKATKKAGNIVKYVLKAPFTAVSTTLGASKGKVTTKALLIET